MNIKHLGKIVFDQTQIKKGVIHVSQQLNEKFEGQSAVVITVVPGGIIFTADLVRELTFDVSMDTISCPHTQGNRNNDSNIVFHQNIELEDQNVILIDDAIEPGGTMKRIVHYLNDSFNVKSLTIATLFVKSGRVNIPANQCYCYEIEGDDLLVGYGLPWKDKYRNIPYISMLIK